MDRKNGTPSQFTIGGIEPVATSPSVGDIEQISTGPTIGVDQATGQRVRKSLLQRLSDRAGYFTSQAPSLGWSHPAGPIGSGETAAHSGRHHEGHNIIHDRDDNNANHDHHDHNVTDPYGSDYIVDFGDHDHCGDSHDYY